MLLFDNFWQILVVNDWIPWNLAIFGFRLRSSMWHCFFAVFQKSGKSVFCVLRLGNAPNTQKYQENNEKTAKKTMSHGCPLNSQGSLRFAKCCSIMCEMLQIWGDLCPKWRELRGLEVPRAVLELKNAFLGVLPEYRKIKINLRIKNSKTFLCLKYNVTVSNTFCLVIQWTAL